MIKFCFPFNRLQCVLWCDGKEVKTSTLVLKRKLADGWLAAFSVIQKEMPTNGLTTLWRRALKDLADDAIKNATVTVVKLNFISGECVVELTTPYLPSRTHAKLLRHVWGVFELLTHTTLVEYAKDNNIDIPWVVAP